MLFSVFEFSKSSINVAFELFNICRYTSFVFRLYFVCAILVLHHKLKAVLKGEIEMYTFYFLNFKNFMNLSFMGEINLLYGFSAVS